MTYSAFNQKVTHQQDLGPARPGRTRCQRGCTHARRIAQLQDELDEARAELEWLRHLIDVLDPSGEWRHRLETNLITDDGWTIRHAYLPKPEDVA